MTICLLALWAPEGVARFPTTPHELRVVVTLVAVGFLLAVCFVSPLVKAVRFLDERKSSRGTRGRRFVDRTARLHPLALRGRDLRGEDLAGACLANTDLSDADLRGADLSGADLENACLRGALYDAQTRWPEGFEPRRHGAVREG